MKFRKEFSGRTVGEETAERTKKVERGILYFAIKEPMAVRPADGKKFTLEEWQMAVEGYVETVIPAMKGWKVFANEQGKLQGLPLNPRTWEVADRHVYMDLNFYAPTWLLAGNILVIFKTDKAHLPCPTIAEAMGKAVRP